jgi:ATP-dependent Clp protease ATP-binding subunit ClpC
VLERFNEGARLVVVMAQEEARALRHGYIGTEHLLLGLAREEKSVGAFVLRSLGVKIDEVRAEVSRIVGLGDEAPSGHMPFTPRAKVILELALRESLALRHRYIGTEHILLGLAREGDGVANRILFELGATSQLITERTLETLGEFPPGNYFDDFEGEGEGMRYRWLELRDEIDAG